MKTNMYYNNNKKKEVNIRTLYSGIQMKYFLFCVRVLWGVSLCASRSSMLAWDRFITFKIYTRISGKLPGDHVRC